MVAGLAFHYLKHRQPSSLLLVLVIAGSIYNSIVIWSGSNLGVSPTLELLNRGRYLADALMVPLLFIVAAMFTVRAGPSWAAESLVRVMEAAAGLMIVAGILAFSVQAVEPITYDTLLWYKINHQLTPSWAVAVTILISILSNLFFVVLGYFFWKELRWPWLGIGAVLSFVLMIVPGPAIFIAESVSMVVLCGSLVATDHFLLHHPRSPKA